MAITEAYNDEKESLHISTKNGIKIIPLQNENGIETSPEHPLELNRRAMILQISISLLVSLPILSSSMCFSFSAITFDYLTNTSNPIALSEEEASWFASINTLMCPVGALISSFVLDKYGRKKTLYFICILALLSWSIIAISSSTVKRIMFIELIVARIIIGISAGLSTSATSVYIVEIVHPKLRGMLSVLTILSIAIGIWITYILGYLISDWRLISGLIAGFCLICIFVLIPIPETPNWLASKGLTKEAEESQSFLNGFPKTSMCNNNMKLESNICLIQKPKIIPGNTESMWMKIRLPTFLKPLGIMVGFFTLQHFCGVSIIIVYAVGFANSIGVSIDPFLCAIFIGLSRILASVFTGILSIWFGRRVLVMSFGIISTACMFGIITFLHYRPDNVDWLPLWLLLAYVFSGTIGLVTISFALIAEIYPQNVRAFASGITIAYGFTIYFLVVKLYPGILREFGIITITVIFAITSLLSVFFGYFILPETRNKTFQEIDDLFKKREKL